MHRTRPITPINYRDNHQNEHSQLKEKIYKYKKGKKHAKIVKFAVTLIKRKLCATPALASCHRPLALRNETHPVTFCSHGEHLDKFQCVTKKPIKTKITLNFKNGKKSMAIHFCCAVITWALWILSYSIRSLSQELYVLSLSLCLNEAEQRARDTEEDKSFIYFIWS